MKPLQLTKSMQSAKLNWRQILFAGLLIGSLFWFVVAMLVNTYCNLPTQLTHGISVAARCGLSATLFLIGGGLSIEVIRKVGLKPLVLGIILWAVISVASLAVILLL